MCGWVGLSTYSESHGPQIGFSTRPFGGNSALVLFRQFMDA